MEWDYRSLGRPAQPRQHVWVSSVLDEAGAPGPVRAIAERLDGTFGAHVAPQPPPERVTELAERLNGTLGEHVAPRPPPERVTELAERLDGTFGEHVVPQPVPEREIAGSVRA